MTFVFIIVKYWEYVTAAPDLILCQKNEDRGFIPHQIEHQNIMLDRGRPVKTLRADINRYTWQVYMAGIHYTWQSINSRIRVVTMKLVFMQIYCFSVSRIITVTKV